MYESMTNEELSELRHKKTLSDADRERIWNYVDILHNECMMCYKRIAVIDKARKNASGMVFLLIAGTVSVIGLFVASKSREWNAPILLVSSIVGIVLSVLVTREYDV